VSNPRRAQTLGVRSRRGAPPNAEGLKKREDEIHAAALELFREKGYQATSMREIGDAVGMLKGSLYTYIRSKEDLLAPIFERCTEPLVVEMERIVADGSLDAHEQLRAAIRLHVRQVAEKLDVLTVFVTEWRQLSSESLAALRAQTERYVDLMVGIIERGIREEAFRPVDPRMTVLGLIGMCNWMVRWYRPDGRLTPDQIAEHFFDLVLRGLDR
jgi:TetR/AcrR family transcriptional regulator, cholesterol catabolism regulator